METVEVGGAAVPRDGERGDDEPARLTPGAMRAWRAFLQAHAVVIRRLEAELAADTGLSLAHYDVLVQLARADERRLRMHELADRVLLSRSGVSRLVDRLEADGLVSRLTCAADARGSFAVLTEAGLGRLREATPTHFGGVGRHFVDRFTADELDELAGLLERLPRPMGEPMGVDEAARAGTPRAPGT